MSYERQTTPSIIEALDKIINRHLTEMHISMPVEIVSYDYSKNMAIVQPVLKRKYKSENEPVKLPTISNVPVAFPRMGDGHLRIPINPGDTGQLIINERSIDAWLVSGGIIDPKDSRKHSLSDGVFYPGLNPENNPIKSSAAENSLELKLKDSYFEILGNGKFKITNGTEELFDLLVQLLTEIIDEMNEQGTADFTNTIFGPQQPINFAKYNLLKVKYETIKTKLTTLKG